MSLDPTWCIKTLLVTRKSPVLDGAWCELWTIWFNIHQRSPRVLPGFLQNFGGHHLHQRSHIPHQHIPVTTRKARDKRVWTSFSIPKLKIADMFLSFLTFPLQNLNPLEFGYGGFPKMGGTPKSSIFMGSSITYHPFLGTYILGNTHILEGLRNPKPRVARIVDLLEDLVISQVFKAFSLGRAPRWCEAKAKCAQAVLSDRPGRWIYQNWSLSRADPLKLQRRKRYDDWENNHSIWTLTLSNGGFLK